MKKIGLIGGMSWESSHVYYKIVNEKVRERLGGHHSCPCVMESVDFAEIAELQHNDEWKKLDALMVDAAQNLERANAEVIVLCTNTMHLCSEEIIKNINIPFIHIVTAIGNKIKAGGIDNVLLLGTKFTMESDFYKEILYNEFGIKTVIPNKEDRGEVHRIIYDELVQGQIKDESRAIYKEIIEKSGAKGVILGCTEIPLLIKEGDVSIPIYDTTRIHAESAVEFALGL
ncbi:MAG: aspartate racemase [Marinilabiliales bacterium]|nr:MAG: aspartate racemase [Marinilabiliales bacterium]